MTELLTHDLEEGVWLNIAFALSCLLLVTVLNHLAIIIFFKACFLLSLIDHFALSLNLT